MEFKRTVEVVLEAVELRTTDSIQDDDEVLVSICVFPVAAYEWLFWDANSDIVLVSTLSEKGAGKYVCDRLGVEIFVLAPLGNNFASRMDIH